MNNMLLAKVDCSAGKTYTVQKNLKTAFFSGKNWHHLTLGGHGGKTVDTRLIFGCTPENFGV